MSLILKLKKEKFTEEEDNKLYSLFKQYGSRWSSIAKYFPKRTADMIKNRYHSSIKKRIPTEQNESLIKESNLIQSNIKYEEHYTSNLENTTSNISNDAIIDNKNNYSTITSKESESIYNSQYSFFNSDIPCFEYDVKSEESLSSNTFNFNFDDLFTL